MPPMAGRSGGRLMVPGGGRRSSCHPGGMGMGASIHSAARRASSRSEQGIGLFPNLLGGGNTKKVFMQFYVIQIQIVYAHIQLFVFVNHVILLKLQTFVIRACLAIVNGYKILK